MNKRTLASPFQSSEAGVNSSLTQVQETRWDAEPLVTQIEAAYEESGVSDFWPRERDAIYSALSNISGTLKKRYLPLKVLGV